MSSFNLYFLSLMTKDNILKYINLYYWPCSLVLENGLNI